MVKMFELVPESTKVELRKLRDDKALVRSYQTRKAEREARRKVDGKSWQKTY